MTAEKIKGSVSINPATNETLEKYPFLSGDQVEASLERVEAAFRHWRATPLEERLKKLRSLAAILRRDKKEMATLMTLEMGKPIKQSLAEVEKCAVLCDWVSENAAKFLSEEPAPVKSGRAYVAYRPIGAIFAVMPWNFPFWQVLRGAAGILAGGNAYVLKHSSNVMGCAFRLEKAFWESGFPEGLFTVLNIDHETSARVIADRRIAAATVTGSVRAGSAVAATAGEHLKKTVLELGGSDPFIILADADLEKAVSTAVEARYQNSGQVCIAAKRFIVEESVLSKFTEMFVAKARERKTGDPLDEKNDIGPLARRDLRDELHNQVQVSIREGAKLLLGGHSLEEGTIARGNYYATTVLTGVTPGMTSFREEVFGPVASIISARDADHAVQLANESDFGLSGAIWTADVARGERLAGKIETGGVFINAMAATDPHVPVGGVKKSGYGRELSYYGLREFLNVQTVWVDRH